MIIFKMQKGYHLAYKKNMTTEDVQGLMLVVLPPLESEGIQQQVISWSVIYYLPNINDLTNGNLRPEMIEFIMTNVDHDGW